MFVKKELRQRLRRIIDEIPAEARTTKSLRACHRLFQQAEYVRAEVLMVFFSIAAEIDIAPIVLRAWQDGKRVLAPKVSWEQRRMIPVEIRSLTEHTVPNQLGMREPVAGVPIPVGLIDIVVVPGLGFDEYGNRLGRGRGFYDRFLAHPDFDGTAIAVAFEEQFTHNIPVGPLDKPVNMLLTDECVRRFKH